MGKDPGKREKMSVTGREKVNWKERENWLKLGERG